MAQLSVTTTGTNYTIDFDNTVAGVNNSSYDGSPPQATPSAGDLDSDAWDLSPFDYEGTSTGGVGGGGWYGFNVGSGNYTLGAQPSSSFNNHSAELTFVNNTGSTVSGFEISFRLYAGNSQSRNSTITCTAQSGSSISETSDNIISTGTSSGSWKYIDKSMVVSGLSLANGATFTITWDADRGSGSGSSDEWALDDIVINFSPACTPSSVTSFSPTSATNGQTITITGTGFGANTTAVEIGGVAASSFTVVSSTQITAIVGAGASSGDVRVTTDGCIESASGFTYLACIPQTIASFYPTEGPRGTWITISGTDFTTGTGTDAVWFGNKAASIISVSATELVVQVPDSVANGTIEVRTDGCIATTTGFTFIESTPCASNTLSDLIISELYDISSGSLSYIELFNGTGAPVDLTNYTFAVYNNGNASPSTFCGSNLSGTLNNGDAIVYSFGGNSGGALGVTHLGNCGINVDDCVHLEKNGVSIDVIGDCSGSTWVVGNSAGYTYIRKSSITSPSTTYSSSDWITFDPEITDSLGAHTFNQGPPPVSITQEPDSDSVCDGDPVSFQVTTSGGTPTFQWKEVSGTNTTFSDVTNGGIYSGATTTSLNLSAVTPAQSGNQYYVEITNGSCVLRSRAVQLYVEPKPITSSVFHN